MNQMVLTVPNSLITKLSQLARLDGVTLEQYAVYTLTERASTINRLQRVPADEVVANSRKFDEAIRAMQPADDAAFAEWFADLEEADPDPDFTPELRDALHNLLMS